jgi:hypothetical protein
VLVVAVGWVAQLVLLFLVFAIMAAVRGPR